MAQSAEPPCAWLHIGTGAFHRAHQAFYLDRLKALAVLGETPWRLIVGNIKPDLRAIEDSLQRSGGSFHLETVTPQGERALHLVRAISQVVGWQANLIPLIDAGADPSTRIISFTVTEAGYYVGSDGLLDAQSPDLIADLAECTGATIYGAVARLLQARMSRGLTGVTLLCCDNIRENGRTFRIRLSDFLGRRGAHALQGWVDANCTFPDCMVDRITPRATDALRTRVQEATGLDDAAAVMAEDYVQWVIEDDFAQGRPRLELAGVEFVRSVRPYEEAKIRVLNASHALLAWRGAALKLRYIHECVAVPEVRQAVLRYVTEDVMACLPDSPVDLVAYRDRVISRFSNPHIQDTVARVAADGFAKISGWVAPTLQERLDAGAWPKSTAGIALAFLAFLQLWRSNEVDFTYADQTMQPKAVSKMLAEVEPVSAFACNADLWGRLAGRADLINLFKSCAANHTAGL